MEAQAAALELLLSIGLGRIIALSSPQLKSA
jgi:hypothetical protein